MYSPTSSMTRESHGSPETSGAPSTSRCARVGSWLMVIHILELNAAAVDNPQGAVLRHDAHAVVVAVQERGMTALADHHFTSLSCRSGGWYSGLTCAAHIVQGT